MDTEQGNTYQTVLYSLPEQKLNQVLLYQLLNSGYSIANEKVYDKIPEGDSKLSLVKDYVFTRYASILQDSSVSFLAVSHSNAVSFYRMVFLSLQGRYEIILAVSDGT